LCPLAPACSNIVGVSDPSAMDSLDARHSHRDTCAASNRVSNVPTQWRLLTCQGSYLYGECFSSLLGCEHTGSTAKSVVELGDQISEPSVGCGDNEGHHKSGGAGVVVWRT
jgi:hypothetical protein